ncbi:MAG: hypothetical protein Q8L48_38330 [Archangium sp.]|nr:hypothetical protein [Archangium sp.]
MKTGVLFGLISFGVLSGCEGAVSDLDRDAPFTIGTVTSATDAGRADAGSPIDSGVTLDAGGPQLDAGVVDAGVDAGVVDAGVDAGVVGVDAGATNGGPGCTLPPMPDCSSHCCTQGGTNPFVSQIYAAQDLVHQDHPEWFDSQGLVIVGDHTYTAALAARLEPLFPGCAVGGFTGGVSADEIGIKVSNALSIHVDVVISTGQPWAGTVWSCMPADF